MLKIINSYILGVDNLEKIMNTINFNNLYVYGGFNYYENNHILLKENLTCAKILGDTTYGNQQFKMESVIDNFFSFREDESEKAICRHLLGDKTKYIRNCSFQLNNSRNVNNHLIQEWLNNLYQVNDKFKNELSSFISFSVSYIINSNNMIDILVIEGTAGMEEDINIRMRLIDSLFSNEELHVNNIETIYIKELNKLQIDFHTKPTDIDRDKYQNQNIPILKKRILDYDYLFSDIFKNIDYDILYVYISLMSIFYENYSFKNSQKMNTITNPKKLYKL